jgi:spore germination protein GerM
MRSSHPSRRGHLIGWTFLLLLVIFGGLFLRHFMIKPVAPPVPVESQRQLRTLTLYFAAADGSGLVAEGRETADCLVEVDCLRATVQALLDGPVGDLTPVFPPQAVLLGINVVGSEVHVDFDRALVDNHPGGSWGELLTVYALADTVAENFPHLRQVRIFVEGTALETLKGHVDLRQPLAPDFSLVVKPAAGGAVPAPAGRSQ